MTFEILFTVLLVPRVQRVCEGEEPVEPREELQLRVHILSQQPQLSQGAQNGLGDTSESVPTQTVSQRCLHLQVMSCQIPPTTLILATAGSNPTHWIS